MKTSSYYLVVVVALVGCEAPELPAPPAPAPAPAVVEAAPTPAPVVDVGPNGTEAPPMETPVTKQPRPFTANDPIQGRRSRNAGGYLGAVGGATFYAKHQIMIQQITESLASFNALSGINGGWPKSHEEFMEKIVKPLGFELPKLDEPLEYIFVPEEGEKGLQIRLRPDYDGEVWPPGANPADADPVPAPIVQPNQPNQPAAEPAPRAVGVEGAGAAAGVAPLDLQQ